MQDGSTLTRRREGPAIERDEVARIARLAQLDLDERQIEALTRDLGSILDHVGVLDELDLGDVVPAPAGTTALTGLREDVARPGLSNEDALKNAPDAADGHFRVPRVLEE